MHHKKRLESNKVRIHIRIPICSFTPYLWHVVSPCVLMFYDKVILYLLQAMVRPNAGHAVVLNWTMTNLYGVQPGEVGSWQQVHNVLLVVVVIVVCSTCTFRSSIGVIASVVTLI